MRSKFVILVINSNRVLVKVVNYIILASETTGPLSLNAASETIDQNTLLDRLEDVGVKGTAPSCILSS